MSLKVFEIRNKKSPKLRASEWILYELIYFQNSSLKLIFGFSIKGVILALDKTSPIGGNRRIAY